MPHQAPSQLGGAVAHACICVLSRSTGLAAPLPASILVRPERTIFAGLIPCPDAAVGVRLYVATDTTGRASRLSGQVLVHSRRVARRARRVARSCDARFTDYFSRRASFAGRTSRRVVELPPSATRVARGLSGQCLHRKYHELPRLHILRSKCGDICIAFSPSLVPKRNRSQCTRSNTYLKNQYFWSRHQNSHRRAGNSTPIRKSFGGNKRHAQTTSHHVTPHGCT